MKNNKAVYFRISQELLDIANQSMKMRAARSYKLRTESFSEYLRNLMFEEFKRNKEEVVQLTRKIENEKATKAEQKAST